MNAPADHMTLAPVELLPLTACTPSETHVQAKRRARYTEESIAQLSDSLKGAGQLEAILVRPLAALRALAKYEIVFGERRWLAAEKAGLAHVRAEIRDMSDEQVITAQLVENLQREGLDPLDEAEGYRELMQVAGIKAEAIGGMIGKSRSYVYGRLKLLDVSAPVEDALRAGRIDQSTALLLARIPVPKLQLKALKIAVDQDRDGKALSYREIAEKLREKFMVRLDGVPFPLDDYTLQGLDGRTACTDCQHCSLNDPELQKEVTQAYAAEAIVCTDKPCHNIKVQRWFNRVADLRRSEGREVIEGDAAKAIKRDRFEHSGLRGYVDLDKGCHESVPLELIEKLGLSGLANIPRNPTYRELLGDQITLLEKKTAVLIDPFDGRPRDILPLKDAAKALKSKGVDIDADESPAQLEPRSDMPAERTGRAPEVDFEARRRAAERQQQRHALELAVRRRVLDLVHERWKGPLKREDLEAIANRWLAEQDTVGLSFMDWYYGGRVNTAKMTDRELGRLVLELAVWSAVEHVGDSPGHLLALAKRHKIDVAKVRKQMKAELGQPEETPFDEPARKKRKAKKKVGTKARKK